MKAPRSDLSSLQQQTVNEIQAVSNVWCVMSQYGHVMRAAVSHSAALLYSAELQPGVKYEICAECLAAAVLQLL